MRHGSDSLGAGSGVLDRLLALQRLIAAAIGAFIIGMVGFSHMSVAHNAGHDYRHSMAFPCH